MTAMRLKRYPSASGGFSLGKMGVGATLLKQGKTARDYVQDGLVAMWDGIENAGWGVHDPNATTWKDLSGHGHDIAVQSGVFNDTSYNLSVRSVFASPSAKLAEATIEFVGLINEMANDSIGIYLCLPGTNIAFGRYNTKGIFSQSGAISGYGSTQFILPTPYPRSMSVSFFSNGKSAVFDGATPVPTTEGWNNIGNTSFVGSAQDSGHINSIRIYSRALTADEIARNYAIDKERFNLP